MSGWRPPEWKNPYYDGIPAKKLSRIVMAKGIGFEEGADEMLVALRHSAPHLAGVSTVSNLCFMDGKWVQGSWVFIPDDTTY